MVVLNYIEYLTMWRGSLAEKVKESLIRFNYLNVPVSFLIDGENNDWERVNSAPSDAEFQVEDKWILLSIACFSRVKKRFSFCFMGK